MKRIIGILFTASILLTSLVGCSSGDEQLVSKTPFPEFSVIDILSGETVTNDIFADYDATIVNFWNNGCGTCIEEMPELEEMFHQYAEDNINLIGVGADSGESDEQLSTAQNILAEKGVTYVNLSPDPESSFYKDFISELSGYPTTYIVDSEGNIVGASIIGNVKKQEDTLSSRVEAIRSAD